MPEPAALQKIKFQLENQTAVELPYFSTWEESYSPVEITGQTEAGTDTVIIVRSSKLEVNAGGVFLADTVAVIETFKTATQFTLTLPDGTTHTVRMRDYKKTLKAGPDKILYQAGVWAVSFKLIEF